MLFLRNLKWSSEKTEKNECDTHLYAIAVFKHLIDYLKLFEGLWGINIAVFDASNDTFPAFCSHGSGLGVISMGHRICTWTWQQWSGLAHVVPGNRFQRYLKGHMVQCPRKFLPWRHPEGGEFSWGWMTIMVRMFVHIVNQHISLLLIWPFRASEKVFLCLF